MHPTGRLELATILRSNEQDYFAAHTLSANQRKAWRAIVNCRTAALGGHVECCDHCGLMRHLYHSCRNRHCPKCQTRAKEQWLAARGRECLPVPYTHLVFTVPHALNGLAGSHFRLITDILFDSSAATLLAFAKNPRWIGGTPAITSVLHTWNQKLERHLHIHALMPSGALTEEGQWKSSRRGFLFPVGALSNVFREKFMDALKQARQDGKMSHEVMSDLAWKKLLQALRKYEWNVYAKQPLGGAQQVLEYLSRYTHRVGISNERLLSITDGQIRFKVRDPIHPEKKRIEQITTEQFINRFLQHVLPQGFKRIRHYGLLANCHKKAKLMQCRLALNLPKPDPHVIEEVQAFMLRVKQLDLLHCPNCKDGTMCLIETIPRPPWRNQLSTGPPP